MPTSGSPTVRRRLLAAELRRLRVSTGKTAEEVGRTLGWSKAKISRYELGQGGLKPEDVSSLLEVYEVPDNQRARLRGLAEDAKHKGWWESYSDVLSEENMEFIGLEAEATSKWEWQVNVIPGLLQTEAYAKEILSGYQEVATVTPRTIQRRLETRLTRQGLLSGDAPLEYRVLLDESVLRRQRGDRPVMRDQLARLAELSDLENVTIQVLPFESNHGLAVDSFSVLQFGKAQEALLHDVVSVEHLSTELYVEGDIETHTFRLAFDHLAEESLDPGTSREFILAIAGRVWDKA